MIIPATAKEAVLCRATSPMTTWVSELASLLAIGIALADAADEGKLALASVIAVTAESWRLESVSRFNRCNSERISAALW
jgi:hypothetical protein